MMLAYIRPGLLLFSAVDNYKNSCLSICSQCAPGEMPKGEILKLLNLKMRFLSIRPLSNTLDDHFCLKKKKKQ